MAEDVQTDFISLTSLTTPKISRTRSTKSLSDDSRFLKLVKQNDIRGVKRLFEDNQVTDDLIDDNEIGRSAFIIAIDDDNCDMIQCLLELELDPGDALFHAIETHNTKAVETICDHLPEPGKVAILNRFPVSASWPSTSKPLMLAARQDNFRIVQTLIQHGAEMPSFEDLHSRVADDSYGEFLALLHWYEAVSNESYILLTSDDPLETIFGLGRALENLDTLMKVPRFGQKCDRTKAGLAALSTKLLDLARDDKEVELLLNGGEKMDGKPRLPLRLRQALDIGFKDFVSHPSSQDYMVSQWQVSPLYVLSHAKARILQALLYLCLIIFFFVPCILYILLPIGKLHIMQKPFVRFLLHLASKLYFLLLLIVSTIRPEVVVLQHGQSVSENLTESQMIGRYMHYKARPWDPPLYLIVIWIFGMTYRTIRDVWATGLKSLVKNNAWNLLDGFQLLSYWVFIAMSIVAYVQALYSTRMPDFFDKDSADVPGTSLSSMTTIAGLNELIDNISLWTGDLSEETDGDVIFGNYGNESRYDWNEFDPMLVAEAAFAVANVLTYLHLLHSLLILGFLGPLLISFRGMAVDVLKFFIIFTFVTISFSLGLTQLYRTFETLDLQRCLSTTGKSECAQTPFLSFWHSLQTLFWSLFNLIDLDNLSVADDLYFTEAVGSLLYAAFMVVGVIVLLNALIAMMSNTYTRVEENSEVEWKVARTRLMAEYMTPSVTLPPPFNLVPSCKTVLRVVRLLRRKCFSGKSGSRQPATEDLNFNDTVESYRVLSRALSERCQRASHMEKVKKTHRSKANQEMADLKKSVDALSQEMKVLQLQIQTLVSNKHPQLHKTTVAAPEVSKGTV